MACSALPSMPPSPRYRPAPLHRTLGEGFFDVVEPARFPEHLLRFRNQRWAERVGLGALDDARVGAALRALRAAAREPPAAAGAPLPRPSVPRVQPRSRRRPRLPLRAAPRRRGRPPARSRHQGQRPDAVVARRRRPAHAQGRRARGARDRDARGARRLHLEVVQPVRDRRDARARRRAVADALVGAGAARPLARPLRHLPAPRATATTSRRSRALLDFCVEHYLPEAAAADGDTPGRVPARRRGAERRASCAALDGRGLRPRRAQHRQHERHRRELRLRPVPLPADATIPDFIAAYFDQSGLYAFGRQPDDVALEPRRGSPRRCCRSRRVRRSTPALASYGPAFERRARASASSRGSASRRAATTTTPRSSPRLFAFLAREPGRLRAVLLRLVRRRRRARRARRRAGRGVATTAPTLRARCAGALDAYDAARTRASRAPVLPARRARARCSSTRSRRSGTRSPSATTGGRSTPSWTTIETLRLAGEPLVRVSESSR